MKKGRKLALLLQCIKLTYYLNVFSPLTINIKCIAMQVNVQYNCGRKNYYIRTPWRKKAVRRLARRRDSMFNSAPLTSIVGRKSTISTVAHAVQEELKVLCSTNHDSGWNCVKCSLL